MSGQARETGIEGIGVVLSERKRSKSGGGGGGSSVMSGGLGCGVNIGCFARLCIDA